MAAAAFDRATMLDRLRDEEFDVLVIGGGITGAGVALDAVTRGLRTALVERDDFASGTSRTVMSVSSTRPCTSGTDSSGTLPTSSASCRS